MGQKDLGAQVEATYKLLRIGLAALAFIFPPLLAFGGWFLGRLPLAGSMSAYYHASDPPHPLQGLFGAGVMRNEFVGVLFAVSALLIAYQGYSDLEDKALNLAGILAVGVALLPMSWPGGPNDGWVSPHGACAVTFFLSIAYVCIFRAGDTVTEELIPNPGTRAKYIATYRSLGGAMVLLPTMAWILSTVLHGTWGTFFVEAAGIYVFATYWAVKSHETSKSDVDKKAARGRVRAGVRGQVVTDAVKALPVIVDDPKGDPNEVTP
jgi:hypothetical protein